jgi:hypothetical protein
MSKTTGEGRRNRVARAYLAALDRLIEGRATHPDHAGRPVRITPAAVAKEAHRSRNPLYTTRRALLAEIDAAGIRPTPATDLATTIARLEACKSELRQDIRQLQADKRNLATENLSLLHRARLAEDRLAARDREIDSLKKLHVGTPARMSSDRAVLSRDDRGLDAVPNC